MLQNIQHEQLNNSLPKLIARTWMDKSFSAQFQTDPKAVLENEGIEFPEGTEVHVESSSSWQVLVEPTQTGFVYKIPMPHKPVGITDEQLAIWCCDDKDDTRVPTKC